MDKIKQKNITKIIILVALFAILLTLDLVSKQLVCAVTRDGQDVVVIENVLEFTYSENTGASFGIFGENTLMLTIFTSIVCVGMVVFLFWKRNAHVVLQTGLVVMLAGAIGNLVDRIAFSYVRDFINYKFLETLFNRPFAICNFADFVLIVGAIIMIVYVLFFYDRQFKQKKPITENSDISEINAESMQSSENIENNLDVIGDINDNENAESTNVEAQGSENNESDAENSSGEGR